MEEMGGNAGLQPPAILTKVEIQQLLLNCRKIQNFKLVKILTGFCCFLEASPLQICVR